MGSQGTSTVARAALLQRITVDPQIFDGKPIVRGMRISVETVLGLLAEGESVERILDSYPRLERDDIRACLEFARTLVAHESIEDIQVAPA
jgi:uncharacterized protein (DUF433 family)